MKKYISNNSSFLKKHFNVLALVLCIACAAAGSYGIFKLMGYLNYMGTGVEEQIAINTYLFSAPFFLFFALVIINFWRKGFPTNFIFSKNTLAATVAVYLSIFIIGGMASRTLFAKKAGSFGYTHCPETEYSYEFETTNQPHLVQPTSMVWTHKNRCKNLLK